MHENFQKLKTLFITFKQLKINHRTQSWIFFIIHAVINWEVFEFSLIKGKLL